MRPFRERNPVADRRDRPGRPGRPAARRVPHRRPAADRRRPPTRPRSATRAGSAPATRSGSPASRSARSPVGLARDGDRPYVRVDFRVDDDGVRLGDATGATIRIKTCSARSTSRSTPAGAGPPRPGAEIPLEPHRLAVRRDRRGQRPGRHRRQIDTEQLAAGFTVLAQTFADTPAERAGLAGRAVPAVPDDRRPRRPSCAELLAHAHGVTGVLADRDEELRKLIADGNLLLAEVQQRRDAIHDLLVSTNELAAADLRPGRRQPGQLGPALSSCTTSLGVAAAQPGRTSTQTIQQMAPFINAFTNVLGNGRWFDSYVGGLLPARTMPGSGRRDDESRRLRGRWPSSRSPSSWPRRGHRLCRRTSPTRRLTAHFTRAVGVYAGSDVRVLGVRVGAVERGHAAGRTGPGRAALRRDATGSRPTRGRSSSRRASSATATSSSPRPTPAGPALADGADLPASAPPRRWSSTTSTGALDELNKALGPNGANADRRADRPARHRRGEPRRQRRRTCDDAIDGLGEAADHAVRRPATTFRHRRQPAAVHHDAGRRATSRCAGSTSDLATRRRASRRRARRPGRGAAAASPPRSADVTAFIRDNRDALKSNVDGSGRRHRHPRRQQKAHHRRPGRRAAGPVEPQPAYNAGRAPSTRATTRWARTTRPATSARCWSTGRRAGPKAARLPDPQPTAPAADELRSCSADPVTGRRPATPADPGGPGGATGPAGSTHGGILQRRHEHAVVPPRACWPWPAARRGLPTCRCPAAPPAGSSYHVTAEFADVLDLVPQAAVKVNDVTVGSVEQDLRWHGWTARVRLQVNGTVPLPANATAAAASSPACSARSTSRSPRPPTEPAARPARPTATSSPWPAPAAAPRSRRSSARSALLLNGGGLAQLKTINEELDNGARRPRAGGQGRRCTSSTPSSAAWTRRRPTSSAPSTRSTGSAGHLAEQRDVIGTALDALAPGLTVLAEQREQLTAALTALGEPGRGRHPGRQRQPGRHGRQRCKALSRSSTSWSTPAPRCPSRWTSC